MIFSKDIRHICALCEHAVPIDEDTMLCLKKGPVSVDHTCRRFKYDPLLRKPARPAPLKTFKKEDFML